MQSLIHLADKQTGEVLDYITEDNYWRDNRRINLTSNRDTFDFITFSDKAFSTHIQDQNRLVIPDKKVGFAEFIIDQHIERLNQNGSHEKQVYSTASYLRLKKAKIIDPQETTAETAAYHTTETLKGTGWNVGKIAHTTLRSFNIEEHTNPYSFLKRIASEFNLELQFRIAIENGKIVRYVDMLERIGRWRGFEVTFGHNLLGIERKSKSTNVVTALLGVSPADVDGQVKTALIEDQEALKRWGVPNANGQLQHLYAVYHPQSSDPDMTQERLETLTTNELEKRVNATIEYTTDIATLSNKLGQQVFIGDTVRVKDEKFNPALYLEARVHTAEGSIKEHARTKIVLGDYVEFTQEEVMSIWRSLQKQVASKIEDAELRDYTYNKLTIDDKDTTVFEDGKTFAELQANDAQTAAESYADTVSSQAQSAAESYADAAAGQALIDAQNYAVAQTVYDNKMTEIASDLSDKADITYVDGELVSKANKGDVYTIEEVDNALLNKVSVTQYQTDMDGVVQDLNTHSTLIGQNQDAIALKADSSRVDMIEGTVQDHSAELTVMSDEISSKVEADYVDGIVGNMDTRLRFDGMDDYVEVNNVGSYLNSTNSFTVEFNIKYIEFVNHMVAYGNKAKEFWFEPFKTDDVSTGISANFVDTNGTSHQLNTGYVLPSTATWYWLSYTWDGRYLKAFLMVKKKEV
ncbi:phage tail spike protein [Piscibacillus salipiscarius]|uniref:phage tail spike protein n=1 Tax=Piscibacillus salipiscarius TaxID=299480 RepID=UPI0006D1C4C5|nr:phage tail spike protein [Piscibacillus salipiscarius]